VNLLTIYYTQQCWREQPAKVPTALIHWFMQQVAEPQEVFEMQDGEQHAIVLMELMNKIQKITVNLNALSKAD